MKRTAITKRQAWLTAALAAALGLPMSLIGFAQESPLPGEAAQDPAPRIEPSDDGAADPRQIRELTPKQAELLVATQRLAAEGKTELNLDGLTTLDADTARVLAEFKGKNLNLSSLTTLDTDAVRALAEFKGGWMGLKGLTTLDADAAKALAGFKGRLFLPGQATLDALTKPK